MISCHILTDTVEETGPEPEDITEATTIEELIYLEEATASEGATTGRNLTFNSIDSKKFDNVNV